MDGVLSTWIKVHFLIVMSFDKGLQGSPESTNSQCSCYTFHGPTFGSLGRYQCRTQGGDLVSMETVEEWEFVKTQIQNRTSYNDEWWIGLEKREGEWKWLSNHSLTYNKWQPGEPSMRQHEKCVVMAKNNTYGLFDTAKCGFWKGVICEYETRGTNCKETHAGWCNEATPPTTITDSKTDLEEPTTSPDQKTKTSMSISTTVKTSMTRPNVPAPSTRTISDKERTLATSEYPTTTAYQEDTEMPTTTTQTDDVTTTGVSQTTTGISQTTKKPFTTLTIIIAAVLVGGMVVFLCFLVLCVCGWKLKRKGKPKTRLRRNDTNTEHNTSDVIAGSSSGLHVNEQELKAIIIHPNNASAQDDSHASTYRNALDNSNDTKKVNESSHGCLAPQMIYDNLVVCNHSNMTSLESTGRDSNQNKAKAGINNPNGKSSLEDKDLTTDDTIGEEKTKVLDIYATVDKSKKKSKTTKVVYAEVNKSIKIPADQHEDLVTYAEPTRFNHDATRSVPKAPPSYHPTESASVSTTPVRCQNK